MEQKKKNGNEELFFIRLLNLVLVNGFRKNLSFEKLALEESEYLMISNEKEEDQLLISK